MAAFYTANELAGLPGMPETERGVQRLAERCGWESRPRRGRGGGREWGVRQLPRETRDALARREIERTLAAQAPALLPNAATGAPSGAVIPLPVTAAAPAGSGAAGALVAAPGSGGVNHIHSRDEWAGALVAASEADRSDGTSALADWQRQAMHARAGVLALVEQLAATVGGVEAAFAAIDGQLAAGTADPATVRLFRLANLRRRGEHAAAVRIARSTLYRWRTAASAGGALALAPEEARPVVIPPWARAALELWRAPAKPSIRYVAEKLPAALAAAGVEAPSYSALRRFLTQRLGALARNDGRMGPRELKTIAPFVRRDTSKLWPADVYTADGHTFDAEVAHPAHGRPFRPEITSVLDVATRKCVGWSLALDESGFAVLDAQRHAFSTHGVCSIWYVDRGSGYANALQWDETTGMAARLGFSIKHSLPYNSQARGLEERSHRTIWVEAARKLPTFVNAAMDAQAKNKVFKLVRRDVKAIGSSRLLLPWEALAPFLQAEVDAYNARPHRGLPRLRDADGKLRHQSPNEAWAQAVADGWRPHAITAEEARDLWWPQKVCKVARGEIRIYSNTYFHAALAEYHGEPVRVAFDIHDAGAVLVRDMAGRLICEAKIDGNKRDYFGASVIAQAAEKRAAARARRLQAKLDEVEAERAGQRTIEHAPGAAFDWPDLVPAAAEGTDTREALGAIGSHKPELAGSIPAPATPMQGETAIARVHCPESPGSIPPLATDAPGGAVEAGDEDRRISNAPAPAPARPVFAYFFERYEWLMAPEHRAAWTEQDRVFLHHYAASDDYDASRERYEAMGIAWTDEEVFKGAREGLPARARL